MPAPSGKSRNRLTTILVLATVVILIFSVVGLRFGSLGVVSAVEDVFVDVSGYLQKGISGPFRWFHDVWISYVVIQDAQMENEALQAEISRLQEEITHYREALIANTRLRRLLDLRQASDIPKVAAHVVGMDFAPWVAAVTVDRGRRDGVGPGMVVQAGAGLVGQTIESSHFFSKVLLISDHNSAIAALIQRNRARGILRGTGNGMCRLAYVDDDQDVEVGDDVVTSGTDGIFPKGLLVGKVVSVEPGSASDLFQVVTVSPTADLGRLEEVLIHVRSDTLVETIQ